MPSYRSKDFLLHDVTTTDVKPNITKRSSADVFFPNK